MFSRMTLSNNITIANDSHRFTKHQIDLMVLESQRCIADEAVERARHADGSWIEKMNMASDICRKAGILVKTEDLFSN